MTCSNDPNPNPKWKKILFLGQATNTKGEHYDINYTFYFDQVYYIEFRSFQKLKKYKENKKIRV